jgi:hypothetical protein
MARIGRNEYGGLLGQASAWWNRMRAMPYSLELLFHEPVTLGQLARYLELLRAAGATVLEEIHPHGDESILDGWAYRPDRLPAASDRAELILPAPVVRDALDILGSIADSDGDARSLQSAVEDVRAALRKSVMAELGLPEVES